MLIMISLSESFAGRTEVFFLLFWGVGVGLLTVFFPSLYWVN